MKYAERFPRFKDQDDLRLLALSRIPRCADCSRLRALQATHESGAHPEAPFPPIPAGCETPYCEPLAARYAGRERRRDCAGEARDASAGRTGTAGFTAAPVFGNA